MSANRRSAPSIAQRRAIGLLAAVAFGFAINVKAESSKKPEFLIAEKTVVELQEAMAAGRITSKGLTAKYLARIKAIDKAGPHINAIIELAT